MLEKVEEEARKVRLARRMVVESDSEEEVGVEAQVRVAGAGESGRAEKRRKAGGANVRLGGGGKPGVLE